MNLYYTGLSELYKEVEALGDPLTGISDRIDFEKIRPMLSDLYENDTEKGGRLNYDPIIMVKILLLQQWYLLWIRLRSDNMSMEKHLYRGRVKGGGVFNLFPIPEVTIW
jgi:hypothetical protein